MGSGWRSRALYTTLPRDTESIAEEKQSSNMTTLFPGKLRLFSSSVSNPSTPCLLNSQPDLRSSCRRLSEPKSADSTPRRKMASSPSKSSIFSIFKTPLRLSKKGYCGVCLGSVKIGKAGMAAIYTAECSHCFHFPCISHHVRRKQGSTVCPVCNLTWKDVPLLLLSAHAPNQDPLVLDNTIITSSIPSLQTIHHQSDPATDNPFKDDEPLLSPTAGGRGLNRAPSTVDVKLLPAEAAVISVDGRSHETIAVSLRVQAPPPPPNPAGGHRAPIDLVSVLNVSGTMISKLQMLQRAMRLVISSLGTSDRLSIVAFSSSTQRLLPLRRMTPKGQNLARRIIDQLSVDSDGKSVCTAALRIAGKVLEDRREKNPVATIIFLSDGLQAVDDSQTSNGNDQRQPRSHVSSSVSRFGHIEIPVHSYGPNIADAFTKRVGGLLSLVVQDLRLQLGFSSGEITAVYSSCNGRRRPRLVNHDSVKLGDLYAEEERELLLELRVPCTAAKPFGSRPEISVRFSYRDPWTGGAKCGRERALLVVPQPHAVRYSDQPDRIQRLRSVFVATRAVAETRRLVEDGELGSAQQLLESARELVAQSCSSAASAEEYVRWLDAEMAELQLRRRYWVQQREQQIMEVQRRRRMGGN